MARDPFGPVWGWKKVQIPLAPAGHATMNRGPMMVKFESDNGLVTTTWLSLLQSE
jgi:hypothetical protein